MKLDDAANGASIMHDPCRLSTLGSISTTIATLGILGLAIANYIWAQAITDSRPQQQPLPVSSESNARINSQTTKRPVDHEYIIGNSDLLKINVWKEPGLTESIPVRTDGKISMPLIGELQASGMTPKQLKQEITTRLRSYLTAPNVTVTVLQMNSQKFNILGEVNKPGSYPLTAGTTVVDAIADAGGFRDFAKTKSVYVLRKDSKGREAKIMFNYQKFIKGKGTDQNIVIRSRDIVVVP